jgi:hypothetical protein
MAAHSQVGFWNARECASRTLHPAAFGRCLHPAGDITRPDQQLGLIVVDAAEEVPRRGLGPSREGSSILSRSNDPVPVETRLHRDAAPGGSVDGLAATRSW